MITLKTLAEATPQEVFDQVKDHLLKQGKRAMNDRDQCQYRAGSLQCAAGCLVAEDEYDSAWEGCMWDDLVGLRYVPEAHMELIESLQTIHDEYDPEDWEESLKDLAEDEGLEWNTNSASGS